MHSAGVRHGQPQQIETLWKNSSCTHAAESNILAEEETRWCADRERAKASRPRHRDLLAEDLAPDFNIGTKE